jgi:hypothetical protein
MKNHEGPQLNQEDVPILQDHPAERRSPRDLQEPEAQAAAGLTGSPAALVKGVFLWRV